MDENGFDRLPIEIVRLLLGQYVGPQGTANLSSSCKSLNVLCRDDDIWKAFCCRELQVLPSEIGTPLTFPHTRAIDVQEGSEDAFTQTVRGRREASYHCLYTRLLHPFRGLFKRLLVTSTTEYGEVLTLSYLDGFVWGICWFLPQNIMDEMKPLTDFSICVESNTGDLIVSHEFATLDAGTRKYSGQTLSRTIRRDAPAEASYARLEVTFGFRVRSLSDSTFATLLRNWLTESISHPDAEDGGLKERVMAFLRDPDEDNSCGQYSYRQLESPGPVQYKDSLPLGLFKASYGPHGNELIQVKLTDSNMCLKGLKLTGDPNVPAGKISFSFRLDRAIRLNADQQENMELMHQLHTQTPLETFELGKSMLQPFKSFPHTFFLGDDSEGHLNDVCLYRFVGHGTEADEGYVDPREDVPAQLVVFSPEKFLVLWLNQNVVIALLYHKVSNDDAICQFIKP